MFRHDGNPVLRWNASNVCVTRRADDSLLPKKEHPDSPNKIDGIDALLLAMGGLSRSIAADDTGRSCWEDPDYQMLII
jgi:phage terminase large subunit-like protein